MSRLTSATSDIVVMQRPLQKNNIWCIGLATSGQIQNCAPVCVGVHNLLHYGSMEAMELLKHP